MRTHTFLCAPFQNPSHFFPFHPYIASPSVSHRNVTMWSVSSWMLLKHSECSGCDLARNNILLPTQRDRPLTATWVSLHTVSTHPLPLTYSSFRDPVTFPFVILSRLTWEISSSQSDLCPHGTSWKGLETTTKNSNCEWLNVSGP